jgi:3-methyladenine DNA glycosylase AlkD
MDAAEIVARLKGMADPTALEGMARYGINPQHAYGGISVPTLRALAKEVGRDHALAEQLWASGVHEARILASMVDDPKQVTEEQMERWVRDFNSWDLCDQVCGNLFDRTPFAHAKAVQWSQQPEEFVRRAGFALMAWLAVHDKQMTAAQFEPFFPLMIQAAADERNFVKKAVNWALRSIGKRSPALNARAIEVAREMQQIDAKAARWIAADALRELTGEAVQRRLRE